MGPRYVPTVIVLALLAFAVAAAGMAFVQDEPRLWSAAIALVVLGGITPLIYAVNIRIMPVFSRRSWQHPAWLQAGVAVGIGGAWLVFFGRATAHDTLELLGHLAALYGGCSFIGGIVLLFRSPVTTNIAPPLPFPEQAAIDRVGILFTRLAGVWLLLGLSTGVALTQWTPERGRWDLVWAHMLLLGWFVMMASGVAYHVLSRWTGARWRSVRRVRLHLLLAALGAPAMVGALALDLERVFAVAGTLQATAVALFIWNVAPLALRLPGVSRYAVIGAVVFLALGVSLGASAAIDPVNHTRLRFSHAEINLLGWAGLLVCGMGYYLFPRFAGQPLRWPRIAPVQVALHVAGVLLSAGGWWWYLAVDDAAQPLITAGALLVAASFATFTGIMALTFRHTGRTVAQTITFQRRQPSRPG